MTGSDRQHNMGDRERQSLAPGTECGTKRGESFSDAVFAIVVTQLILDVQVPPPGQLRGDPIDLLLGLWPSYAALVVSFLVIGRCQHGASGIGGSCRGPVRVVGRLAANWLSAGCGHRLVDTRLDPKFLLRLTLQDAGSFVLYLGAVVLSLVRSWTGLTLPGANLRETLLVRGAFHQFR